MSSLLSIRLIYTSQLVLDMSDDHQGTPHLPFIQTKHTLMHTVTSNTPSQHAFMQDISYLERINEWEKLMKNVN